MVMENLENLEKSGNFVKTSQKKHYSVLNNRIVHQPPFCVQDAQNFRQKDEFKNFMKNIWLWKTWKGQGISLPTSSMSHDFF